MGPTVEGFSRSHRHATRRVANFRFEVHVGTRARYDTVRLPKLHQARSAPSNSSKEGPSRRCSRQARHSRKFPWPQYSVPARLESACRFVTYFMNILHSQHRDVCTPGRPCRRMLFESVLTPEPSGCQDVDEEDWEVSTTDGGAMAARTYSENRELSSPPATQ